MKIAVVTNDGSTVSQHFGRSRYFKVFTISDRKVTNDELRERKFGHFAGQHSAHHSHQELQDGHGMGLHHREKHRDMAQEISDCQILIAGGMGQGAYLSMHQHGLEVILTEKKLISEVIEAYLSGDLQNLAESRVH